MFCLIVTVPVVNYEEEKHQWNRHLYCLQCVLGPLFGVTATKGKIIGARGRVGAEKRCSVPVVNYEEEKGQWNRHLNCFQCVLGPLSGVTATKGNIIGTGCGVGDSGRGWGLSACTCSILLARQCVL